jgi:hypothetical protein
MLACFPYFTFNVVLFFGRGEPPLHPYLELSVCRHFLMDHKKAAPRRRYHSKSSGRTG